MAELNENNNKKDSTTNDNSPKEGISVNNNNISNNVNQEQTQYKYEDYYKIKQNTEKNKKSWKCDCTCSEQTKFTLKIVFCPCYFFVSAFGCFWDNRCQIEPYYHSYLFLNNVIFFIFSLIDLIFVIIYKGEVSKGFFIVRIISDSLGMIIFWLALGLWTEEATDEDHMDPACYTSTLFQGCLTILLNIASLILFFKTDCEFKIVLLILQIINLIIPLSIPTYLCFSRYCSCCYS